MQAHQSSARVSGWFAVVTLLCCLSACQSFEDGGRTSLDGTIQKVAVVDIQAVFERSRGGKKALDALIAEFGEHRRILTEEEATLKEIAGRLEQENLSAGAEEHRLEIERYLARLEQYRVQVQAFNQDLARKHRALVNEYLPKIAAVAKPLAEQEGFSTVLHQGRPETVMIVYYRAPSIDLTDRVIEELDREPLP